MHKCVNNTVGNVYHLEQMVDSFFPYSQKQLGFDKPVTVIFQSDEDNASRMLGKTAYYDPNALEVVLYTDNRHPKDVMRSLSHELVHHAQNCRGDFTKEDNTGPGYAQSDPHLRKMEREAYTKGNLIFRDFEDLIKTGKINIEIDFSDSGEPKMSLKEWKNAELNRNLMKKWGYLKEEKMPMKTDVDDADDDGKTDDQVPAFLEEDSEDAKVEEGAFAPNHYCVHHGGVQHEGQIKMAEAVSHNFDSDLNKVTWYDMKLEDGTILEQVAAEDIQVTSASLAEMHHAHRVEDDEEDEMEEGKHDKGIGSKMSNDMRGDQYGMDKKMDIKGGRVTKPASQRLGKRRSLRGMKAMVQEKMPGTGKISVREAKEITRSIIERIRQENTDNE